MAASAPTARHFPSLDGLRGVAVMAVFFYHYGAGGTSTNPLLHAIGGFVKIGWAGVTLFFLLSGFLITGILWDSRGETHWWRNFYVRRVLRIFPLYYGSLVLYVLVAGIRGQLKAALHFIWVPSLFLMNFPSLAGLGQHIDSLGIFHYWSLAVEEQFYLLWPLLIFLMASRKQAARLCLSVFAVSLLFRVLVCALMPNPLRYDALLLTHAGELALGGWIAIAYRSPFWDRLQRALPLTTIVSAIVIFAVAWYDGSFQLDSIWQVVFGLCAVTVFLAAILARSLEPGILKRMTSATWLRWVGKISFGIYVYHVLFMGMYTRFAAHIVSSGSMMVVMGFRELVAGICTVAIAWVSYTYYERPFLRAKARLAPHEART